MGRLLIVGSVILSGLLLGDLSNKYVLLGLFCLISFAGIGIVDDYKKIKDPGSKGLSSSTKIFYQIVFASIIALALFMSAKVPNETMYIVPFFKDCFRFWDCIYCLFQSLLLSVALML